MPSWILLVVTFKLRSVYHLVQVQVELNISANLAWQHPNTHVLYTAPRETCSVEISSRGYWEDIAPLAAAEASNESDFRVTKDHLQMLQEYCFATLPQNYV